MGNRLERALAEADDIEAAEADQTDRPIPAHVKVSRPNRSRSKVLQVRLNPEELDALEAIAERRGLPVSTVARDELLRFLTVAAGPPEGAAALVQRLLLLSSDLAEAVGVPPGS